MSLLEQNNTRKKQVDKKISDLNFDIGNIKEYKVEVIWDNAIYTNKMKVYLQDLYYLVVCKSYFKGKNI